MSMCVSFLVFIMRIVIPISFAVAGSDATAVALDPVLRSTPFADPVGYVQTNHRERKLITRISAAGTGCSFTFKEPAPPGLERLSYKDVYEQRIENARSYMYRQTMCIDLSAAGAEGSPPRVCDGCTWEVDPMNPASVLCTIPGEGTLLYEDHQKNPAKKLTETTGQLAEYKSRHPKGTHLWSTKRYTATVEALEAIIATEWARLDFVCAVVNRYMWPSLKELAAPTKAKVLAAVEAAVQHHDMYAPTGPTVYSSVPIPVSQTSEQFEAELRAQRAREEAQRAARAAEKRRLEEQLLALPEKASKLVEEFRQEGHIVPPAGPAEGEETAYWMTQYEFERVHHHFESSSSPSLDTGNCEFEFGTPFPNLPHPQQQAAVKDAIGNGCLRIDDRLTAGATPTPRFTHYRWTPADSTIQCLGVKHDSPISWYTSAQLGRIIGVRYGYADPDQFEIRASEIARSVCAGMAAVTDLARKISALYTPKQHRPLR